MPVYVNLDVTLGAVSGALLGFAVAFVIILWRSR